MTGFVLQGHMWLHEACLFLLKTFIYKKNPSIC